MRRALLALLVVATLGAAAPGASACQFAPINAPPAQLFWKAPPLARNTGPDEIVLEIEFMDDLFLYDPLGEDVVIMEGCGSTRHLYKVLRVLHGADPGATIIISSWDRRFERLTKRGIVVGRPAAFQQPASRHQFRVDAAIPEFIPRSPGPRSRRR